MYREPYCTNLTLAGPWLLFPELRGATTHPPPTTNMKTRRTKTPTTHRADRRSSDYIDERAGSSAVGGEQGRAKRSKKEGMHEHPVEEEAFPRGGGGAYIAPVELKRIREVRVCGGVGGVDEVAGWVESVLGNESAFLLVPPHRRVVKTASPS